MMPVTYKIEVVITGKIVSLSPRIPATLTLAMNSTSSHTKIMILLNSKISKIEITLPQIQQPLTPSKAWREMGKGITKPRKLAWNPIHPARVPSYDSSTTAYGFQIKGLVNPLKYTQL